MKRVLLINTNTEKNPYPAPPLGLCLISANIEKKYEVKIFDGMFREANRISQEVIDFKPDYIGISIRNIDDINIINPVFYADTILNNFIKPLKKVSSAPIILGGSGFSIFPFELMKLYNADYGVVGEGEEIFPMLLNFLGKQKDVSTIPGVITKDSKDFIKPLNSYNISCLSFPEIDKRINFSHYREKGAYSIQTKRGCAHRCLYCTYPNIEGRKLRLRPAKSVADEIEQANQRLGYTTFEFVDSTFNDPPGNAEKICREISKRKLNIRLRTMGINPANVTGELFALMLSAGFTQIDCTPDSASPQMLVNFQKNFTISELEKTAKIIKQYDMPAMWFFIFGGPGETRETIKESFDFIDKWVNKYDMVLMTIGLRIYPDTDLYTLAIKQGVIKPNESLLFPRFYISEEFQVQELFNIIKEASSLRPNCIPLTESTPSEKMLKQANKIREELNLTEPMFRTFLRLRYQMFDV